MNLDNSIELAKMERLLQMSVQLDPMAAREFFIAILNKEGYPDIAQKIQQAPAVMPGEVAGMQGTQGVPSETPLGQGRMPNLGVAQQ